MAEQAKERERDITKTILSLVSLATAGVVGGMVILKTVALHDWWHTALAAGLIIFSAAGLFQIAKKWW